MSNVDNDPAKLRGLSGEMRSAGTKWTNQIEELAKAKQRLLKNCQDQRIDEFAHEFDMTVRAVGDMVALLGATSKHLDVKADEFERMQKI